MQTTTATRNPVHCCDLEVCWFNDDGVPAWLIVPAGAPLIKPECFSEVGLPDVPTTLLIWLNSRDCCLSLHSVECELRGRMDFSDDVDDIGQVTNLIYCAAEHTAQLAQVLARFGIPAPKFGLALPQLQWVSLAHLRAVCAEPPHGYVRADDAVSLGVIERALRIHEAPLDHSLARIYRANYWALCVAGNPAQKQVLSWLRRVRGPLYEFEPFDCKYNDYVNAELTLDALSLPQTYGLGVQRFNQAIDAVERLLCLWVLGHLSRLVGQDCGRDVSAMIVGWVLS